MELPSTNNDPQEPVPGFLQRLWIDISTTLNLRKGADIPGTIEGIKKDIDFKGPNVYILICSIIIASIGLNVNSAPAIIGAMLISPLMGPILGMGLSIGTYDWTTLKRSLHSLGIAVFVSLVTSYIYPVPVSSFDSCLKALVVGIIVLLFGQHIKLASFSQIALKCQSNQGLKFFPFFLLNSDLFNFSRCN